MLSTGLGPEHVLTGLVSERLSSVNALIGVCHTRGNSILTIMLKYNHNVLLSFVKCSLLVLNYLKLKEFQNPYQAYFKLLWYIYLLQI